MSTLASEIVKLLKRRKKENRLDKTVAEVDQVLNDLGIPTSASKGVPVHLRVKRVSFRGTKRLRLAGPSVEAHGVEIDDLAGQELRPDFLASEARGSFSATDVIQGDDSEQPDTYTSVPFSFSWEPVDGVNCVGSGSNLRGKSSLLNVLLWSLTGRCAEFSVAVKSWIEHVEVDWAVGAEIIRVAFDANNGEVENGTVTIVKEGGSLSTIIATFDNDSFEDVMSSIMLNRLRLEAFTVSQSGKSVMHRWVSYAGALWVRPKYLKSLIGKEATLSIRLMQMFIGTDWVPVLATASTVDGTLKAKEKFNQERTRTATDAVDASRSEAVKSVETIKSQIALMPAESPDPQTFDATRSQIGDTVLKLQSLQTQLLNQSVAAKTVRQQLKSAKARHHTEIEDALLTKFFHQMKPTVCPRCSADITQEQLSAESDIHQCSVCTKDLNLTTVESNLVDSETEKTSAPTPLVESPTATVEEDTAEEEPINEIEALEQALNEVAEVKKNLREEINKFETIHHELSTKLALDVSLLKSVEERRNLELELARAEGAVAALTDPVSPIDIAPVDSDHLAVAHAAKQVLSKWVKEHQDPLLTKISKEVERLVVNFGADGLSKIKLNGAANMEVSQNDTLSSYGQVSPGEQLRLKIATVIALIKHGYAEGIGRHPGFLLLDSPATEEMPDGDLAIMVSALLEVSKEAPMQIIVATRSTGPLVDLLPEANRIIAKGDDFVW